jgi:hypothetical protein
MLLQVIALARTGQLLLRSNSTKTFFMVALYVDNNMVVSRYIVMQTEGDNAESDCKPVSDNDCVWIRYSKQHIGFNSSEKLRPQRYA